MTDFTDLPAAPPSHGWLIYKAGRGYYRPNAQGYTSSPAEAGRYTYIKAMDYSHPNGLEGPTDGITIKHESEVQGAMLSYSVRDHAAAIADLREIVGRMTPGEWRHFSGCEITANDPAGVYDSAVVCLTYGGTAHKKDDAAGIVALRNTALPIIDALMAEVERQRSLRDQYREAWEAEKARFTATMAALTPKEVDNG